MARTARLSVAGEFHLVTLEGRGAVFTDEADCVGFLAALAEELRAQPGVALCAWVLMPSQVRLLAVPETAEALSALMQGLGRRWVPQYNARHGLAGSPWVGRYRSAPVDPEWALRAMRAVESGPVRSGITERAWEYRWSSCAERVSGAPPLLELTETEAWWALGNTPFDRQTRYMAFLAEGESESWARELETALSRGRPYGSAAWMDRAGIPASRRPTGRRPGRPRKKPLA